MSESNDGSPAVSRRVVLHGAAAGALGAALVGCGSEEPPVDAGSPTSPTSANESPTPTDGESSKGTGGGNVDGLVATDDVPVGSGVVIDDEVVVTQPESGTFKAFTAVCTHEGCIVSGVADNVITCPCHGSQFSASDGAVEGGPAPAPLAEVDVKVVDGQVVRA